MTPFEEGLYHQVNNAIMRLNKHGMFARGSHPFDWAASRRRGVDPVIVRGGTHLEGAEDEIHIIQGVFYVHLNADNTLLLRYPAQGQQCEEKHFQSLEEAVAYIVDNWKGPPDSSYPYMRRPRP